MQTPWEFACEWYNLEQIKQEIARTRAERIPDDVLSDEFAEWITGQYRLAMAKGIQIGREQGVELACSRLVISKQAGHKDDAPRAFYPDPP